MFGFYTISLLLLVASSRETRLSAFNLPWARSLFNILTAFGGDKINQLFH